MMHSKKYRKESFSQVQIVSPEHRRRRMATFAYAKDVLAVTRADAADANARTLFFQRTNEKNPREGGGVGIEVEKTPENITRVKSAAANGAAKMVV
jgi:hypothetical protein